MRAKKQAMGFYPITVASAVHMDGTDKNLKDDYSDIKSEIDYARTATTGEKFNTIDERLNTEIGRLKKGFTDVNLIEQDSKERHSIHNTCKGHIHDLIIKGKTLMNLIKDGEGVRTIDKTINENSRIYYFNLTHYLKRGKKYTGYIEINNIESSAIGLKIYGLDKKGNGNGGYYSIGKGVGKIKFIWDTNTISESINEIHTIGLYLDNDEFNNGGKVSFSNFMLFEEGTDFITINNYISDTESSGQKEDKISILSHGKNLFSEYDTAIFVPKGEYVVSSSVTEGAKRLRIKCEKDDLSNFGGMYYDAIGNYQTHQDSTQINNLTFTVTRDCYLTFKYHNGLEKPYNNIQLEKGRLSITYEPYKCDKKDILLPQYGFDEGLRGLNNYIYDELNYIRNVAVKRIEKYIVTGNEKFTIDLRNEYMYCYFILEGCKPGSGYESICNQFNYIDVLCDKDNVENQGKEGFDISDGNSLSFQIPISKLEAPTNEGVKKYFKTLFDEGNPVIVYYELAEPIETPLKESIELTSYNDATYVLFENKIGGTSSFKLPVDISKTINSLIVERNILENKVSTVSNEINQIKTRMIQILSNKE